MKILLVSSGSGSRGGGEIFLDYLGQGLADHGHDVTMWIPGHERMNELATKCARFARVIRADYVNTYDHRARSLATCFNWGVSRRVARVWEVLSPDVIHVNKQNLEDGLDLLRAARICSVPSVCTIHLTQTAQYLRARAPRLRDWIARRALAQYGGVVVAVQEARRAALQGFVGERILTRTIFNGVPIVDGTDAAEVRCRTRRELGLNDVELLILGVGRLVEQKQPFAFLEMAKRLHERNAATRFIWVGDGELRPAWEKWVASAGLNGVVSCVGWQNEVRPYFLAADVLLHFAKYEGLPLAILEAMAAGLPCAVTRQLASEVSIFDDQTVLFADDAEQLARGISDPTLLMSVAKEARKLVDDQMSMGNMITSYEQLYKEVTS